MKFIKVEEKFKHFINLENINYISCYSEDEISIYFIGTLPPMVLTGEAAKTVISLLNSSSQKIN